MLSLEFVNAKPLLLSCRSKLEKSTPCVEKNVTKVGKHPAKKVPGLLVRVQTITDVLEFIIAPRTFIFGLKADEVKQCKQGGYCPASLYESDPEIRAVMDLLVSGT